MVMVEMMASKLFKTCKAPVRSPPTYQQSVFYRPDALPVAQPTVPWQ